jgi:HK97 family phage prohead protease
VTLAIAPADIAGRRAAFAAAPTTPPSGVERNQEFAAQLRSTTVEQNGKQLIQLTGTASVVETWYEMWDFWGPYSEKIAKGAFDKTLAAAPDVAFLLNHTGMTMARTKSSKTLKLFTDQAGNLSIEALLNAARQDCADLSVAVDDGDVDQMSFAFRIVDWSWNDDFDQFTINEIDIDRGDVSAVNYGANPYTSISARARQAFDAIDHLEGAALLAARARLDARLSLQPVEPAEQLGVPSLNGLELARLRESLV